MQHIQLTNMSMEIDINPSTDSTLKIKKKLLGE